jgi:predicted phage-related endonuclease
MAITAEQMQLRRGHLGASDIASLFEDPETGLPLNPWKDQYTLWAEKCGKLEDEAIPDSRKADFGLAIEPAVLGWLSKVLEKPIVPSTQTWRHPKFKHIACHPDGHVGAEEPGCEPVDSKCSGLAKGWGKHGTPDVPPMVRIQATVQMACCGASRGHIGRVFPDGVRWNPSHHPIDFDSVVADEICEYADWWFRTYVLAEKMPPLDQTPIWGGLGKIKRNAGEAVTVPDDLAREVAEADEAAKEAEKRKEAARAKLVVALGEAEIGVWSGGEFTYFTQERKGYTVQPTSFRVLRAKKAKG